MSERKRNNTKSTKLHSFIKLQIINILVSLVIFSGFTMIAVVCDIKSDSMFVYSLVFIGIVSFVCGALAGIKERKKGIICGIISALPLNAAFIIVSLIMNSFKPDLCIIITFLTATILSAVGGIVAVNIRLK
ncbi:MAG: TIGR04086 family membrane protein [Clostridia bacterium]|nr:TIGR04086 family membrane protein [Clostridia bacterium]